MPTSHPAGGYRIRVRCLPPCDELDQSPGWATGWLEVPAGVVTDAAEHLIRTTDSPKLREVLITELPEVIALAALWIASNDVPLPIHTGTAVSTHA